MCVCVCVFESAWGLLSGKRVRLSCGRSRVRVQAGSFQRPSKMVQTASLQCTHALGLEFGSAARMSKRPGSVWNCLWVHAQEYVIITRSRISI